MKKTMPLASFSSGKQGPRAKRQGSWTRVSFLALLVLLMIATTSVTAAGLACNADAECRRNVCISKACGPRPTTNGACDTNSHCFNTATESCIKGKCLARSNLEGPCEEAADCATSEATCQGAKCLMPDGKTCAKNSQCVSPSVCVKTVCATQSSAGGDCDEVADCAVANSACSSNKCTSPSGASCSANAQCTSPLVCIKSLCASKSPTGGDCDEAADCATAGDICSSNKCAASFDPSLMVWDGNKAPSKLPDTSPSVVVNGILFVFEGTTNSVVSVEAYDPVAKTWTPKKSPEITLNFFSVVAIGDFVFLIGGVVNFNTYTTTFYRYDTRNDAWETNWDPLPEGRIYLATAAVGTTIFIFGGQGDGATTLASIRSIDVSNSLNKWQKLTAVLPMANYGLSAATVGTDIYITGGRTSSGRVNTVLKYNTLTPASNPVKNAQSMTQNRISHMSFYDSTNKRLYAVGYAQDITNPDAVEYLDLSANNPTGSWASANAFNYFTTESSTSGGLIDSRFHFASYGTLQVLDVSVPASVKWSPFPNSPTPSAYIAQLTSPDKITALDTDKRSTSFYEISTNTWTAGVSTSNYPSPLSKAASAVVNGVLYVMGGQSSLFSSASVYALNAAGDTWTPMDNLPNPTTGGCAAADGTDIYFYGGAPSPSSSVVTTLYKMDTKATVNQWTTVSPVSGSPVAVAGCAAVVAGRKLLIFGGSTTTLGEFPTDKVQSFDIDTKSWDPALPNPITARSFHSAVFLKGFVYLIGGNSVVSPTTALAKTEVFDVNTKAVTVIADMLTPRYNLGSVTDGTSIFSIGGQLQSGIYFPSLEKLRTPSP